MQTEVAAAFLRGVERRQEHAVPEVVLVKGCLLAVPDARVGVWEFARTKVHCGSSAWGVVATVPPPIPIQLPRPLGLTRVVRPHTRMDQWTNGQPPPPAAPPH